MSVEATTVGGNLRHKCRKCRTEMLIPENVSLEEGEVAVFRCPLCDTEGTVDISKYPMTRMRIVVS